MRKYENYAAALVRTIIDRYIPEFTRLREGLVSRYGALLDVPDNEFDS